MAGDGQGFPALVSQPKSQTRRGLAVGRRWRASNFQRVADNEGVASLALPRLATGVGGLEWGPVKELIESHFSDAAYPVLLYHEYHKGVHASERLPATSR